MESSEIETLINELELRVDRLRSLYEQYFMGIEKTVPAVPQKDVERRIHTLRREQIRNTAQRFRFQMIIQRYNTYQSHWLRICRQIEEGTYKRHVQRAKRKFAQKEAVEKVREAEAVELEVTAAEELTDLDSMLFEYTSEAPEPPSSRPVAPVVVAPAPPVPRQVPAQRAAPGQRAAGAAPAVPKPAPSGPLPRLAPPPPAATAVPRAAVGDARRPVWRKVSKDAPSAAAAGERPAPPAQPAPTKAPAPAGAPARPAPRSPGRPATRPEDLSDARLKQLYAQYVQTRRSRNESTATITYDALAKSLRESSARLKEKHGKAVDFEVSVKDGKTVLKPVVK